MKNKGAVEPLALQAMLAAQQIDAIADATSGVHEPTPGQYRSASRGGPIDSAHRAIQGLNPA